MKQLSLKLKILLLGIGILILTLFGLLIWRGFATASPLITLIDGKDASSGTVTSNSAQPTISGTAPSNALVKIYEQIGEAKTIDKAEGYESANLSLKYDGTNYFISEVGLKLDGVNYTVDSDFWGGHGIVFSGPNVQTDGPPILPIQGDTQIPVDGSKNVYAYLVTLEGGPFPPSTHWTWYSDWTPEEFLNFLIMLEGMGITSSLDGYAKIYLSSGTAGGNYTPVALPTSSLGYLSCTTIPGQPGTLIWDSNQNTYLISKTSLYFAKTDYNKKISYWDYNETNQLTEIKTIDQDQTPIPIDGTKNLNAALVNNNNQYETVYTPVSKEELAASLSIIKWIPNIFIANGPENDYIWNEDALTPQPYINFDGTNYYASYSPVEYQGNFYHAFEGCGPEGVNFLIKEEGAENPSIIAVCKDDELIPNLSENINLALLSAPGAPDPYHLIYSPLDQTTILNFYQEQMAQWNYQGQLDLFIENVFTQQSDGTYVFNGAALDQVGVTISSAKPSDIKTCELISAQDQLIAQTTADENGYFTVIASDYLNNYQFTEGSHQIYATATVDNVESEKSNVVTYIYQAAISLEPPIIDKIDGKLPDENNKIISNNPEPLIEGRAEPNLDVLIFKKK